MLTDYQGLVCPVYGSTRRRGGFEAKLSVSNAHGHPWWPRLAHPLVSSYLFFLWARACIKAMALASHTLSGPQGCLLRASRPPKAAFTYVNRRQRMTIRVRVEGSEQGLTEDVLAQLRKAEEEALVLRKQLADLQAEKVR